MRLSEGEPAAVLGEHDGDPCVPRRGVHHGEAAAEDLENAEAELRIDELLVDALARTERTVLGGLPVTYSVNP